MDQIINYYYTYNNKEYAPALLTKNKRKIIITKGNINLNLGDYECIGYLRNKIIYECPNKIKKTAQCHNCQMLNDKYPCAECKGVCIASLKEKKECMQTPHIIYLASFGNLIKVGVTKEKRYYKRMIEQGADYSTIIARTNGLNARIYERIISKKIPDKIMLKQKIRNLEINNPNLINEKLKEIKNKIPKHIKENTEITKLRENLKINNKELINELKGEIISWKGRILILKEGIIDLNKIIGRTII